MNRLTLEWTENNQTKTFIVTDQLRTKQPGAMRIGRNPLQCDLVLHHPTVSGLHVEIFYDASQSTFFIRNLRDTNPPFVDHDLLLSGVRPLAINTSLCLGEVELRVVAIALDSTVPTVMTPTPSISPTPAVLTNPVSSDPTANSPTANSPTANNPISNNPTPSKSAQKPTYGLQCPMCGKVSPYEHLRTGCNWCGASLAAAASILMIAEPGNS